MHSLRLTALVGLAAAASGAAAQQPTWARDVAPILHRHCATCHRDDGAAPFALLSYQDARDRARQIADVTARGFMPPWLPEPGPPFAGERRLSAPELATLARWADAGAPPGKLAAAPAPPEHVAGWRLGEPDLVVEAAEPIVLEAGGDEVFRNLVLPIAALGASRRWVRAVELDPGAARVVHHATLLTDATDSSRRLDAADDRPGFDGMRTFSRARSPEGQLLGWTPGSVPSNGPPDLAWELVQGTDLVLELHLVPSGRVETVRPRVGLWFASERPARRPLALRLGPKTLDIAAGDAAHRVEDRFVLPAAVDLLAVYPHAHYLCHRMTATATLPDGRRVKLLEIAAWDFDWQDQYRYREPVALPAGAELTMEYVYDNSAANARNPHSPPRRVVYGPSSNDEMGDLWLQVVPTAAADFDRLAAALRRRESEADVAGWRAVLARAPDDATARFNLGSELVLAGAVEEGIAELERSAALDPELAATHLNLGNARVALAASRAAGAGRADLERAAEHFERAAAVAGADVPDALFNLANTLTALGRFDEAHRHYQRAVELRPGFLPARLNHALAYSRAGRPEAAIAELERCLDLDPTYVPALWNLALLQRGEEEVTGGAFERLARALEVDPESAQLRMLRADLLLDRDRWVEAMGAYRSVIEVEPQSADAWANLGRALAALGRRPEAKSALERALAIDAGHAGAHEVLRSIGEPP
jgi:tetratricopeptide (TPR) repeat protein